MPPTRAAIAIIPAGPLDTNSSPKNAKRKLIGITPSRVASAKRQKESGVRPATQLTADRAGPDGVARCRSRRPFPGAPATLNRLRRQRLAFQQE